MCGGKQEQSEMKKLEVLVGLKRHSRGGMELIGLKKIRDQIKTKSGWKRRGGEGWRVSGGKGPCQKNEEV